MHIYIKSTFSINTRFTRIYTGIPWAAFVSDQCSRTLSRDSSQWGQKQEFKFPRAASGILVCIWKLRTGGVPSKTSPLFLGRDPPFLSTQASSSEAFGTSHLGFIFILFSLLFNQQIFWFLGNFSLNIFRVKLCSVFIRCWAQYLMPWWMSPSIFYQSSRDLA